MTSPTRPCRLLSGDLTIERTSTSEPRLAASGRCRLVITFFRGRLLPRVERRHVRRRDLEPRAHRHERNLLDEHSCDWIADRNRSTRHGRRRHRFRCRWRGYRPERVVRDAHGPLRRCAARFQAPANSRKGVHRCDFQVSSVRVRSQNRGPRHVVTLLSQYAGAGFRMRRHSGWKHIACAQRRRRDRLMTDEVPRRSLWNHARVLGDGM